MQVKVSDLEGKVVGLLFAANWYPPCRGFTQVLVGIYEELKSSFREFEIVYVSSDEDLDAFSSFYGNMPWLAIPFSDLETKKSLTRKYDVEGIPCLIFCNLRIVKIRQQFVTELNLFTVMEFKLTHSVTRGWSSCERKTKSSVKTRPSLIYYQTVIETMF